VHVVCRLVHPEDAGTRVVARFGLYGLLSLSAKCDARVQASATKATEETDLHPGPAGILHPDRTGISTLGTTTQRVC